MKSQLSKLLVSCVVVLFSLILANAATNDPAMHERFWAEDLSGGDLKYSRLESGKETINVYGTTAVLRGESLRQRSSIPATPGKGDAQPFTAFYTITFVNQTGAWKAVAMHTSRGDK